ncbi:diguanylate cyclase [Stanieria cyanosphaera PCC 7437]|uniref:Diguanylate cyclase n=1 Tax=Stanieria cyanosphaera (strain ATCC 29371 / PCC 7437) TaxID=111780 RepID=K9XNC1_STAC7|nr:GGDEF domain-containing protein [Stanieria cyanosphaera]AFZ34033.1 diguanylate cyclase [Stanieria cyanosphaera PCC 7437]
MNSRFKKYFKFIHHPKFCLLINIIWTLSIGYLDYLILLDISLSNVYLLPIISTTWLTNRFYGFIISILAACLWLFAELIAKDHAYSITIWNGLVDLSIFILITYILSQLKLAYEQEKYWARYDGLTGIYNRRFGLNLLATEINRSRRFKHSFSVAYFDLDNFKQVNDRLGHQAGDNLLKEIIKIIRKSIRGYDLLIRLGGDEVLLVLPKSNYNNTQQVIERIQTLINQNIQIKFSSVSLSVGVATFLDVPRSIDDILEKADALMYLVKQRGKNGIEHQIF